MIDTRTSAELYSDARIMRNRGYPVPTVQLVQDLAAMLARDERRALWRALFVKRDPSLTYVEGGVP